MGQSRIRTSLNGPSAPPRAGAPIEGRGARAMEFTSATGKAVHVERTGEFVDLLQGDARITIASDVCYDLFMKIRHARPGPLISGSGPADIEVEPFDTYVNLKQRQGGELRTLVLSEDLVEAVSEKVSELLGL